LVLSCGLCNVRQLCIYKPCFFTVAHSSARSHPENISNQLLTTGGPLYFFKVLFLPFIVYFSTLPNIWIFF
jgi:hypothetical protein